MKLEFIKCGECAGCKLEASVLHQVELVNEFWCPLLALSSDRVGRAEVDERHLPRSEQRRTIEAYRQLHDTQERHWRDLSAVTRRAAWGGCVAPIIKQEGAAP